MWSFFVWLTAAEWSTVILQILILMNLHQPWESQHIFINTTYLPITKQANCKNILQQILNPTILYFSQTTMNCIIFHFDKEFLCDYNSKSKFSFFIFRISKWK